MHRGSPRRGKRPDGVAGRGKIRGSGGRGRCTFKGSSNASSQGRWGSGLAGSSGVESLGSALEDGQAPFLRPRERRLVKVPTSFSSVQQWCEIVAHNLLAEFYHQFRQGLSGGAGAEKRFKFRSNKPTEMALVGDTTEESWVHNLVVINRRVHMVLGQKDADIGGGPLLKLKPPLQKTGAGSGVNLGYMGSYITELGALIEIAEAGSVNVPNVVRSILKPDLDFPGEYVHAGYQAGVPINASQRRAVDSLQFSLEKIHGPPGTGKSTTIFHIITCRVPVGAKVLVTCSRNVAVESIAQKLQTAVGEGEMLVVGNGTRLGDTARAHTLPAQLEAENHLGTTEKEVCTRAKIFLCTIASTGRLMREWQQHTGRSLQVHTVIVDECGCTPESSVALLVRLDPTNLVLVGDHKQLRPTSLVPPHEIADTHHDRSLLERAVVASGSVHRLLEQYRMHPSICQVVSKLFYNDALLTPSSVAAHRCQRENKPLVWVPTTSLESVGEGVKSYVNCGECQAVWRVVTTLRRKHPNDSIAVLTFYKGQLLELQKLLPNACEVEVLTVDSCQGSEFDRVVISTVRANTRNNIGFVRNKQRINVALSRARFGVVLVGHEATMCSDTDWAAIRAACSTRGMAEYDTPSARGGGESVYDALQRAKLECRQQQQQAKQSGSTGVYAGSLMIQERTCTSASSQQSSSGSPCKQTTVAVSATSEAYKQHKPGGSALRDLTRGNLGAYGEPSEGRTFDRSRSKGKRATARSAGGNGGGASGHLEEWRGAKESNANRHPFSAVDFPSLGDTSDKTRSIHSAYSLPPPPEGPPPPNTERRRPPSPTWLVIADRTNPHLTQASSQHTVHHQRGPAGGGTGALASRQASQITWLDFNDTSGPKDFPGEGNNKTPMCVYTPASSYSRHGTGGAKSSGVEDEEFAHRRAHSSLRSGITDVVSEDSEYPPLESSSYEAGGQLGAASQERDLQPLPSEPIGPEHLPGDGEWQLGGLTSDILREMFSTQLGPAVEDVIQNFSTHPDGVQRAFVVMLEMQGETQTKVATTGNSANADMDYDYDVGNSRLFEWIENLNDDTDDVENVHEHGEEGNEEEEVDLFWNDNPDLEMGARQRSHAMEMHADGRHRTVKAPVHGSMHQRLSNSQKQPCARRVGAITSDMPPQHNTQGDHMPHLPQGPTPVHAEVCERPRGEGIEDYVTKKLETLGVTGIIDRPSPPLPNF